ncbi:peptide ABC transporter substrate-binding protein [Paenibacillus marinisediminis]
MRKKSTLVLLSLVLAFSALLSACGSSSDSAKSNDGASTNGASGKPQEFSFNLGSEPPTLDPALSQDAPSFTVIGAIFEGLTRVDKDNNIQPAAAESWDISEDGKTYTFHLRKDGKWSNGDPVTAHDFEYSWKRVLDPNMKKTSPYNYQMYYIKNGEKFFNQEITDPSQVGVKATDDYTLQVELENPTPYFLHLTAFQTYFPVNKKVVEADPKWDLEANTIVSNGPFKMTKWEHSNVIELVQNDQYHSLDEIKLTKVDISMVNDSNTAMNMYETGALDYVGPPGIGVPTDQIPLLKQTKPDELSINPQASIYYYYFNNKEKPFDNKNIRKALSMSIDRQMLIDKVTLGEQKPAFGVVPPGINAVDGSYRDQYPDNYFKEDVEEAKRLLALGLQESGMTELPEITLTYNTDDGHKKIAQAIADMWTNNLGIKVRIENVEWKVFIEQRHTLNYDVARAGWNPDYNDPMTFLDMFLTGGGNNDIGFSNPEYDKLIKGAYVEPDPQKRMDMLAQAEKILVEDEMAIMPIYYYTAVTLMKPEFKNIFVDAMGNFNFTRGYVE